MDWQAKEEARRAWMAEHSLYRTEDEHSSCGVGLVVNIDGKASRKVAPIPDSIRQLLLARAGMPDSHALSERVSSPST